MLIAHPNRGTAELIAEGCERLAERRLLAFSADETLRLAAATKPELILLSLELPGFPPKKLVPKLNQIATGVFIVATYRELSVPDMERLETKSGVHELISHPVDILQVFRSASQRFNVPFRRHDWHNVTLEVFRADGVLIGKACDISEGGMCMDAIHPVSADESLRRYRPFR